MRPIEPPTPDSLIRERELLTHIPVSHAQLWRLVARGDFPAPIKLSERVTVWRWGSVLDWLAQREAASAGGTAE